MFAHQEMRGATACFSAAGLAEGTSAATLKIAAPNGAGIDYAIDGIAYHKADTDNIAMTSHPTQAVLTRCLYLVQIDAAGTVSTKKGEEVLAADLVAGRTVLQWPRPDPGKCPVGGLKVALASSATFTAGVTDFSASNVTVTAYDFAAGMPSAPLAA